MGENLEQEMPEVTQDDLDAMENAVKNGEALVRLQDNPDFNLLFREIFIDAWAITNTMNMASYDRETKGRVFDKMNARGHFVEFMQHIESDAESAANDLRTISQFRAAESDDTEEHD